AHADGDVADRGPRRAHDGRGGIRGAPLPAATARRDEPAPRGARAALARAGATARPRAKAAPVRGRPALLRRGGRAGRSASTRVGVERSGQPADERRAGSAGAVARADAPRARSRWTNARSSCYKVTRTLTSFSGRAAP